MALWVAVAMRILSPTCTRHSCSGHPYRGVHLLAVDTETCALGPGRDRLVQFCAMELDENLVEHARWTQLIHPERSIPPGATAIHGITNAMVQDAPRFRDVAMQLRRLIRPDTIFIAYNAGFDLGILNQEFQRAGVLGIPAHQTVLDPLLLERRITRCNLGATYRRYTGKPLENAHTADADTEAMITVLRGQLRRHAHVVGATVSEALAVNHQIQMQKRTRMWGSKPRARVVLPPLATSPSL